jgi:type VI secretion system protein ImpJ
MEPRKPIFWYQGLFLQPQHFQQHDLYLKSLINPLRQYLQPHLWGVCGMRILEGALKNRIFEIEEGDFIFPSGACVSLQANAKFQPRSFKDAWVQLDKPFNIYLGLRKWNQGEGNVTVVKSNEDEQLATTRFMSDADPEEIRDLHQQGQPAQVKFLQYLLKVFWDNELEGAGEYELIPVARLEFDGQDAKLVKNYVPPSVSLACDDFLLHTVRNIREHVTSRCHVLEEYKNPRGVRTADLQANYINYLLALRSLNRYVPLLYHYTEIPYIHPWHVYGLLRQIIGELSTFTDRVDALGKLRDGTELLPAYDHENLGFCFGEAETLISELLAAILIGAENVIHLVREENYFKAQIPKDVFDDRNLFYLIIKTGGETAALLSMVQRVSKVSNEEKMSMLIARALPGLPLEHTTELPAGLPTRPDSFYFKIDRGSRHWQDIQKSQNICMYWVDAPEDMTVEMVIIRT